MVGEEMPPGSFIATVETSKTEAWLFEFLINRILQDDSFFFLFGFVRINSYFEVFLIWFS